MKHPLSETINNLKYLQEYDIPEKVWEDTLFPLIDRLNYLISIIGLLNYLCEQGIDIEKMFAEGDDE